MSLIRTGWQGLALRFLLARPHRAVLTTVGIALGAALLAAILTLGSTLRAAVDEQMRAQGGTWDVMVAAPDITAGTLAPAAAAAVTALPDVAYAVPTVNRRPPAADTPVEFYVGIGHFPPGQFGMQLAEGHEAGPGELVLPVSLAKRLQVTIGDDVTLPFPGGAAQVQLVGLLQEAGNPATAYFDYTWLSGRLQLPAPPALLVGLRPGVTKAAFADQVHVQFPELKLDLRQQLDDARRNLGGYGNVGTFLGGGALLAAAFLVLGAFGITVQERTRELALLRAIGAGRQQVARLMLREAVLTGAAGAVAGAGLGVLGAWAMSAAAAHYLAIPAHSLVVPVGQMTAVVVAAFLLAVSGAWPAVLRAARIAPLAAMRPDPGGERRLGRTGSIAGVGVALGGCVAVALSLRSGVDPGAAAMLAAVAGLLLLMAMLALLPVVVPAITGVGALIARRWLPVESLMAQRSVLRHRQRAARTAGVLLLGLTVLLTVAAILGAEAGSKELTIRESFPTGHQVTAPSGGTAGFGDDLVKQLRQIPGVADIVPTGREIEADLRGYDLGRADARWLREQQSWGRAPERVTLQPVDYAALSRIYQFGRVEGALGGGIVINRRMAREMGLHLGETLTMQRTDGGGEQRLTITALVDHLPERLAMSVDAALVQPHGAEPPYRVAHIQLAPGADPAAAQAAITATLGTRYAALSYRDATERLADMQNRGRELMAMVAAAASIMLVIAGVGLANTVAATLHERRRELAVLRAIGATAAQVSRLIVLESLLIGLAGSLLGVSMGALVSILVTLPGIALGAPVALPATLMAAGMAAGPILAVGVAYRRVRKAAHEPLMRALQTQ